MKTWFRAAALAAAFTTVAPFGAMAQDYPTRAIRLIVPYTAGGGADIAARIVAQRMSEPLGQPVVVENRGGAGGNIAADFVAKSTPDGYTMMLATPAQAIAHTLYTKLAYDNLKDLAPVGLFGAAGFVLAATKSLPPNTLEEFIAYAKQHAGRDRISYSSAGVGSPSHLATEMLARTAGVELLHVPYKGSGQISTDLISGTLQTSMMNLPAALPLIKNGSVKAFAITSAKSSELAPDIPPVAKTYPGFEAATWYGFVVPTGTPDAAIEKLSEAMDVAMGDQSVRSKLKEQGIDTVVMDRQKFGAYVKAETEKWGEIVKASGAKLE